MSFLEESEESEANEFAMQLLMPEEFVRLEVIAMGNVDLANDKSVSELAKRFQVPAAIMAARLAQIFGKV